MSKPNSKFPDLVVIRGEVWRVEYPEELNAIDGRELLGRTTPHTRLIEIMCKQHVSSMVRTLLHEIKHAYDCDSPVPDELAELLCDRFAGDVTDFYRHNDTRWVKCAV